jgi:hypothetical protein
MGNLLRTEKNCLNCGSEVTDTYCSHCGQKNVRTEINAFSAIGHLLADYFHADGKFFSTLPALLSRPGRLTREYMAGRRKRYVDPFRLYIFCSVLYFVIGALFSKFEHSPKTERPSPQTESAAARQTDSLVSAAAETSTKEDNGGIDLHFTLPGDELPASLEAYEDSIALLSASDRPGRLYDLLLRQDIRINSKNGAWEKEFNHQLVNNIPKMMFFLIPVAAFQLKFLYWRKRKFYLEHLIFQLHLYSFFLLLMLIGRLLDSLLPFDINLDTVFLVWLLIYPLLAVRRNYHQNWFWSVFKFASFLLLYCACIIAGLSITAIITSYTT